MSKTITIPTNCNPYIVVINNHVYAYRAGDTIEVPDEVAEAIEDALELVPKPKKYLSKFAQFSEGTLTEINASDLDGIAIIYAYSFFNSGSLQNVAVPDSVATIGYSAFYKCLALSNVTIGNSVTEIRDNAFADCQELKKMILKPTTPPTIYSNTFANIPPTCVIEVPLEAVGAYKSAPYWSAIANQIVAIEE